MKNVFTDFGLARVQAEPGLTMSGDVIGTMRYMSPEQVLGGSDVDHRADIYSLGVTLYELLTQQPAFEGRDRQQLFKQVVFGQPRSLRKLNPNVPRELETIVHKAMDKDPRQRYTRAGELAEDLRCFIEHRPIKARRPTLHDRIIKWSRRNSDLAWTATVFMLVGMLGMAISAFWIAALYREADWQRRLANDRRDEAIRQETIALDAQFDAETSKELLRGELYAKDMHAANRARSLNWLGEANRLLNRQIPKGSEIDYRGFEWHLLKQITTRAVPLELKGHEGAANNLCVFCQGQRLASVGDDGTIRIWDLEAQRELFVLRDDRFSVNAPPRYFAVDVSADGSWLVTGQNILTLWNLDERRIDRDLTEFPTYIRSAAFSPDGKLVAAHSTSQMVKIVNLTDKHVTTIQTDYGQHRLTFTRDGSRLLAAFEVGRQSGILSWNPSTGERIRLTTNRVPRGLVTDASDKFVFHANADPGLCVTCLPDGRPFASSGRLRASVEDISISPNNRVLAAALSDGSIAYCWLLEDWQNNPQRIFDNGITVIPAHAGRTLAVQFIDDSRLASCGKDGRVRVWSLDDSRQPQRFPFRNAINRPGLSMVNDEQIVFMRNPDLVVTRFSDYSFSEVIRIPGITRHQLSPRDEQNLPTAYAISANQRYVALAFERGNLVLWDRTTQSAVRDMISPDVSIDDLAFSPDFRWLAASCHDHEVRVYSVDSLEEVFSADVVGREASVEFSPNGKTLAYSDSDGALFLIEVASWTEIARSANLSPVDGDAMRFTPDGQRIVAAHWDSVVRVWDAHTLALLGELKGHTAHTFAVAVHPDGQTLASTSADGSLRLWHLPTLTEIGPIYQGNRSDETIECCFSPDGTKLIATLGVDDPWDRYYLVWSIE